MIAMEMGEQNCVNRIVRDREALKSDETRGPEINAKANAGASTTMHVLNRPPDPNESPEPANVTLTDMMRIRTVAAARALR
jgi:hypothetical protein